MKNSKYRGVDMKCEILTKCLAIAGLVTFAAMGTSYNAYAAVDNNVSKNEGNNVAATTKPFNAQSIATFSQGWALAFLPDGHMLVTEKHGAMFLVDQKGQKTAIANLPKVFAQGQTGLHDVAVAPDFSKSHRVYFTFVENGQNASHLVLTTAILTKHGNGSLSLEDQKKIWQQTPDSSGGHPGGMIAFDPKGQYLFLSVGERMQGEPAQNLNNGRGKILRLHLDGSIPKDNPYIDQGQVAAAVWTLGHRNPYGLAFRQNGELWQHEMGPKGGDEFNLIKRAQNYGWPVVSNGSQYSGVAIPNHDTRPDFIPPMLYWTPVISPAGLSFYNGKLFKDWQDTAFIGGLSSQSLIHIAFDANNHPYEAARWNMGARIRDVAVAPDGALWLLEDGSKGNLLRLTPKTKP